MKYTCHSGGCPGADMAWETEGEKYGVHTIAYSFKGHNQKGKHPKVLTGEELDEGFSHVMIANRALKRYPQGQSTYVKSLLARNWFQVKNADSIFAIGKFDSETVVSGGTGWAVQMAIDSDKPVYVYKQATNPMDPGRWFRWMLLQFEYIDYVPILTENFAGIGTRDLNESGLLAVEEIYRNTFKNAPIM